MQHLKQQWAESFAQATAAVEAYLTPTPQDSSDETAFRTLAAWLMDTPYNPYAFAPKQYEEYRSNPFAAQTLLDTLHHALIDDGEVSFVTMMHGEKIVRVYMAFIDQYEDSFEQRCKAENQHRMDSYATSFKHVQSIVMARNPGKEAPVFPGFQFVAHRNALQFIAEVEAHHAEQEIEQQRMADLLRTLRPKAKQRT